MQERFSKLKESLSNSRKLNPIDFAKAIYFASYYNTDN